MIDKQQLRADKVNRFWLSVTSSNLEPLIKAEYLRILRNIALAWGLGWQE